MPPNPLSNNNLDPMQMKNLLEQRIRQLEERVNGLLRNDGSIELSSHRRIELVVGNSRLLIDNSGVTVRSSGTVKVDAPRVELLGAQTQVKGGVVELAAGVVKLDAAMTDATGIVKCNTLQATSVISATYSPGAGNVW